MPGQKHQKKYTDARERGHSRKETEKKNDKTDEERGRSQNNRHSEAPIRRPSISPKRPRKPPKKPRSRTPPRSSRSPSKSPPPPDPPDPEPEPTKSSYAPSNIPLTVPNVSGYTPQYPPSNPSGISSLGITTDSAPRSPQPQSFNIEINGISTSAVFDYSSVDSFVSDNFVQSLKNVESKGAKTPKIWRDVSGNEYYAYTRFKASIRMGKMVKKLKDQTLYIISGRMGQSVILGSKIGSSLGSMGSIDWAPSPNQNTRKASSHTKTMSLPVRSIGGTAEPSPDVPLYSSETSYTLGDSTSTESTQLQPTFSPLTGNNSSQTNYASSSSYNPPHQSYARFDHTTSVERNSFLDSSNHDQGIATPEVAWTEEIPDSGSDNYAVGSGSMSPYPSGQPGDSTASWPSTPPYTENSGQGYYQPPQYKYQQL